MKTTKAIQLIPVTRGLALVNTKDVRALEVMLAEYKRRVDTVLKFIAQATTARKRSR